MTALLAPCFVFGYLNLPKSNFIGPHCTWSSWSSDNWLFLFRWKPNRLKLFLFLILLWQLKMFLHTIQALRWPFYGQLFVVVSAIIPIGLAPFKMTFEINFTTFRLANEQLCVDPKFAEHVSSQMPPKGSWRKQITALCSDKFLIKYVKLAKLIILIFIFLIYLKFKKQTKYFARQINLFIEYWGY